jgi:hypothetical protein
MMTMRVKNLSIKGSLSQGQLKWRRRKSLREWNLLKVRRKAVRVKKKRKSKLQRRVSRLRLILRRGREMGILKRHHLPKLQRLGRNLRRGLVLRVLIRVALLPSLGNLLKKRK